MGALFGNKTEGAIDQALTGEIIHCSAAFLPNTFLPHHPVGSSVFHFPNVAQMNCGSPAEVPDCTFIRLLCLQAIQVQ